MDLLLDYTAHKLDPRRRAKLEQHMLCCPECAEFLDGQMAVWQALDAWEPAPVSADFNHRLWQRIDQERAAPWYAIFRRAVWWKPAVSVAVAGLVVAAAFLFDHPGKRVPSPVLSDESRVTVSEAEQVERTLDDIQLLHEFDATT